MLNELAVRLSHLVLFHPSQVDSAAYQTRMQRAPADRTYGVLFTPRSGSSRLTDIAWEWPVLGQPNECFNPGFMEEMARKLNARDLTSFIQMLRRRPQARLTWGFEATPEHVRQVFLTDSRFLRMTAPDRLVGLIRRDIVAQAVSIDKNRQTRLGHSPQTTPEDIAAADRKVVYRASKIASDVRRLLSMEGRIEGILARFEGPVLRLSHERTIAMTPHRLRSHLAAFLGVPPGPRISNTESHAKIGTSLNDRFAARFRAERAGWLAEIEARRSGYLDRYPGPVDAGAPIA